jgi:alkylation response protein AidB-like acyl-CoA dehydrogenase
LDFIGEARHLAVFAQYRRAAALEQFLGDPLARPGPFSFESAILRDERDEYAEEACEELNRWGLQEHYMPAELGGKLDSYEELFSLMRILSRRDITVVISHFKTWVGALPVLVGGDDAQKQTICEIVRSGGQVSLGLTERNHGADLLAIETVAKRTKEGFVLNGEKWLINNATRGKAISVIARLDDDLAFFFVDKRQCDGTTYQHLPRVRTLGVRGADISGIRFNGTRLPEGALLGQASSGLELALKTLQVSRCLITGAALGGADTALRATLDFARSRNLYGDSVLAIPHARKTLVEAFLDLLICDCVSTATVRGIHSATDQLSLWSAVSKYYVPTTLERLVKNLAVVLGARSYLCEGHWHGIFQKIGRDIVIASMFEGATVVNLSVISTHLQRLAGLGSNASAASPSRLAAVFSLERSLPTFDPRALVLAPTGPEEMTSGLAAAVSLVVELRRARGVDPDVASIIARSGREIVDQLEALWRALRDPGTRGASKYDMTNRLFYLSERFCALFAASACIHMWLNNRESLGPFFARGEWLALSLNRILATFYPAREGLPGLYTEQVFTEMLERQNEGRLFTLCPIDLTRSGMAGAPAA